MAEALGAIQARFPLLDIGSYPYYRASGNGVAIVAKGTDEAGLTAAIAAVAAMMRGMGAEPVEGEPPA